MSDSRMPSLDDFAHAEHCVLEDLTVEEPSLAAAFGAASREPSEVASQTVIPDRLRGRRTTVTLYAEGWADVEVERRGRQTRHHRIDLHYLDPVPSTSRHRPLRLLKAAGLAAGLTAACAIPASFGWLAGFFVTATIVGAVATFGAIFVAFYLSHEKIRFKTLHGRADAIRFGAGLGTIHRFRKLVPKLVEAIADAADSMHDQTAIYLRAEMREHYRLRNEGILSEAECTASTGKILGEFDGPL